MNCQFIKTVFIVMSLCVVNNTHAMDSIHSKSNSISNCLDNFKDEVRRAISVIKNLSKDKSLIY